MMQHGGKKAGVKGLFQQDKSTVTHTELFSFSVFPYIGKMTLSSQSDIIRADLRLIIILTSPFDF